MIIKFSNLIFERWYSIIHNNRKEIGFFVIWSVVIYYAEHILLLNWISLPMAPVSLLGGALAFFLAFRNNSAYDRWWEARKLWGGIVNVSRGFSMSIVSYLDSEKSATASKTIVERHLAYIYALKIQLRDIKSVEESYQYLSESEQIDYKEKSNIATAMLLKQGKAITNLKRDGLIDSFEHRGLMDCIEKMYDLQGGLERIKKTVFPYFYKYFTRIFLWLFIIVLPGSLVHEMGWHSIPLSISISFVFMILDRIGDVIENPLAGRSSGTPISAICRTIEIDLLQMLESTDIPEPYPVKVTRHNSQYLD